MKKILLLVLLLVIAVSGFIFFCKYEIRNVANGDEFAIVISKKQDEAAKKLAEENELKRNAPIDIPDPAIVNIQDVKDKEKPTIALFYVDWCGYCKRFMPIYGEIAKEYKDKYNFAVVHCEKSENEKMVREFGIFGFPSLFIVDDKINYKFPLSGSVTMDKNELKKELERYLEVRKHFK